jgi:hypothetical protein
MVCTQDQIDYFSARNYHHRTNEQTGSEWFENTRIWSEAGAKVLHWHDGMGWTPVVPGEPTFANLWFDDPITAYVYAETAGWQ